MKSTYKLTTVFIIAIVLVTGVSYFWASSSLTEKDKKINSLQEDISSKENTIKAKNNEITSLESSIENVEDFERMLLKGIEYEEDALVNKGIAKSNFDVFSSFYEEGQNEAAQSFADSAEGYYVQAKNEMEDAKSRFEQARKYASNGKYLRLIENWIKATDYAIQAYSEAQQACGYLSSACGYYADGNWTAGDAEYDEAYKHLSVHDNLAENHNAYLSNIDAILDDW